MSRCCWRLWPDDRRSGLCNSPLVPFHLWTPDVYQARLRRFPPSRRRRVKFAIFGVVMRLFLYAPVGDSEAVRVVLGIIAFCLYHLW